MAGEDASEMLAELIDLYLENPPQLLQAIRSATSHKDPSAMQRAAHTFNFSTATLGARVLCGLCNELEALARSEMLEDAIEKLSQVEVEYKRVEAALQVERRGLVFTRKVQA